MKADITTGMKYTLQQAVALMRAKGFSKEAIRQIRMVLTYDAVTEANNIQYDRIYAAVALAIRKEFGFGPRRILRVLKRFDQICGSVLPENEDKAWTDIMEELKDDTGIIIRNGDERLVVEVLTDEEKENYKYGGDGWMI